MGRSTFLTFISSFISLHQVLALTGSVFSHGMRILTCRVQDLGPLHWKRGLLAPEPPGKAPGPQHLNMQSVLTHPSSLVFYFHPMACVTSNFPHDLLSSYIYNLLSVSLEQNGYNMSS